MSDYHQTVMSQEVVDLLSEKGGIVLDATLGGGGHAEALLQSNPSIQVVGMDQDRDAVNFATSRLERFGDRFRAVHSNFRKLEEVVEANGVNGILMDLGVSSHQLDVVERGFSFRGDGPLDMRMDVSQSQTAADVVNGWDEEELARIFWEWGGERGSRRVARFIVERRKQQALRTTGELADLVVRALGGRGWQRIHPATRVFQGLRIAVNDELGVLREGLSGAWRRLNPGGRLVVISFHSLEDRIVKRQFLEWGKEEKTGNILTKKPVEPGEVEIQGNPRSRSAKLRAIEKIN